jgi:uncharacterized membrane protein YuzA (DUF378 family)
LRIPQGKRTFGSEFPTPLINALLPFVVLLVVALIFQVIPMDATIKRVGFIIIGVAAILMLLKYLQLF